LAGITVAAALLGTIRTPTTALYLLVVVAGGLLFDVDGIVATSIASSLATLGLVTAQNAGWLPSPDYAVNITQWITYTGMFGLSGGLTFVALQPMRRALQRADREIAERKRMEEALRESEANLSHAQAVAHIGSWQLDILDNTLRWSAETYRMFGVPPETKLTLEDFYAYVHPADREAVDHARQAALRGAPFDIEHRIVVGSETKWVRERAEVEYDATGRAVRGIGTVQDITDRKQMEEALRKSEARYRAVIEDQTETICRFRDDNTFTFVNEVFCRFFGKTQEELLGKAWQPEAATEDLPLIEAKLRTLSPANPVVVIENRVYSGTGEVRWMQFVDRGFFDAAGNLIEVQAVGRDITDRKQAEEALLRSQQLYRMLVETLPDAIGLFDAQLNLEMINSAGVTLFGYDSSTEMVGRNALEFFNPLDQAAASAAIQRIFTNGLVRNVQFELHRKDGTMFMSEFSASLLPTAPGAIIAVTRDITERQHIEQALRQSEALYHTLVETLPLNIFRKDTAGRFTFANTLYCRTQGRLLTDILGKTDFDLHPRELAEKYRADDERLIASGEILETVEEHQPIDGPRIYVQVIKAPLHATDGSISGIQGAFWDVTDRKRAEDKLQQRTRELDALQAMVLDIASPHPVPELLQLIVERASNLLLSSSGGLYLCHPERQEVECVVSYNTLRDYTGTILKYGEGAAGQVALTGQSLNIEDYRTWSGRARVYDSDNPFTSVLSTPLNWHGDVTGVIHVLRDEPPRSFTNDDLDLLRLFANHAAIAVEQARLYASLEQELAERKRAEEALRNLNAELEQRVAERTRELSEANVRLTELDRLKDEFISRISHELRTPLANIKLYLELLGHGKPEKYEQYRQTVQTEADKLHHHIDDLLEVSYWQTEDIEPQFARLDVNQIVQDVVAKQSTKAQARDLSLSITALADRADVVTDNALAGHVLSRLMANALAYTPRGGAITLRTDRRTVDGQVWVTIEVHDTGPGITEKDLPYIFEPFYRGQAASDYKTPGTGVGLSIARRIMRRLDGRITVDSQPGHGSTFTIWLRTK
ncbi:MAG TPA: PAS domain S-box protein, partial [Anaerolineae bacterium]|nr:PAS domain S-box protein [Anaerolineae bacterium]